MTLTRSCIAARRFRANRCSRRVNLRRFWQGGWPTTVVFCERTHNPPRDVQEKQAALLRAEWLTLDSAHLPFFERPKELAEIIAARSR